MSELRDRGGSGGDDAGLPRWVKVAFVVVAVVVVLFVVLMLAGGHGPGGHGSGGHGSSGYSPGGPSAVPLGAMAGSPGGRVDA
ncbi:hypothetical protein [Nonomuraea rhizosphaerae]|uniref:hypothetical protein n=1 Tax=Nonomuraea rhizosphaerae TaxID=2665663 RepID=UPI001C5F3553|nr:hypothetical protein [Nonomuraea rhizosphaerae]